MTVDVNQPGSTIAICSRENDSREDKVFELLSVAADCGVLIERVADPASYARNIDAGFAADVALLVVLCHSNEVDAFDYVESIQRLRVFRNAKVLLIDGDGAGGEGRASEGQKERVDKVLSTDRITDQLLPSAKTLLTEYWTEERPDLLTQYVALLDAGSLATAFQESRRKQEAIRERLREERRGFVADLNLPDSQVEHAMIEEIDRVLGHPERITLEEGAILMRESEPVEGIWFLMSGVVRLTMQIGSEEIVFHSKSVGPVIGLLSLALGTDSFFTCRAVSEVSVIRLSMDELETAMQASETLSGYLVTVLIRSLARRHRRAVELHIEINNLILELQRERDHLAKALKRLEKTQHRLVESEKMATLGQLAAGVAHDLNNPVAAIHRSAEFVTESIEKLSKSHGDGDAMSAAVTQALDRAPVSAKQERAWRSELRDELGDEKLARRLVKIGITNGQQYEAHFQGIEKDKRESRLEDLESYYELGSSVRNIRSCAERITALVASLRSYARAERKMTSDVDLHKGLEETLLIFGSAMRNVEVIREYGDVPPITCSSGEVNQVWTNLVSNAIEAMGYKGRLRVITDTPDSKNVRVRVCDDGPGMPADVQARIFDMNFTTKHGPSNFGVGLGLTICQQIVQRHAGTISVNSEPGNTCFTVVLPVNQYMPTDTTLIEEVDIPGN